MNDASKNETVLVVSEYEDGWIDEWVAFGLRALGAHLQRHAKYERWCAKHGRAA